MKNYKQIVITVVAMLGFLVSHAQVLPPNQPNQDPCNPMVLCGGGTTTQGAYQGNPFPSNSGNLNTGCLPSTLYSVLFWEVTITQNGWFAFTLTPSNSCDDYDWAVWKLPPNTPCPQDLSLAGAPIRSDANDIFNSPGGQTGLAVGNPNCCCQPAGAGPAFLSAINATVGDIYLVAICNAGTYGCPPGTQPSPVNISFTGSTAVFLDSAAPKLKSIEQTCAMADHITVNISKPIQCGSIATDGSDFKLNNGGIISSASGIGCPNPSGLTSQINVYFTPTLPANTYTLSAQVGTDGNTLLDACDTPLKVPDTLQFTIAPTIPLNYQSIDTPNCSEVRFSLNQHVACDSIAADGSDFAVTGPQPVNVIAAYGIGCDSNYFTDSIVLILQNPIQTDGTYTVHAQKGSDHNTVLDTCGHRMAVGTSISYTINSYDGKIRATPDTVICEPGYVNLTSINSATPPDSAVNCGPTSNNGCTANSLHYAYGKDSLSTLNSPFYSFGKSRIQFIYTAKELELTGMKPGTIRSLAWHVTQLNSAGVPFLNFTIKMGCTGAASEGTNFIANVQTVYSTASYLSVLGWNTFQLSTPFNWDGKSNIVVEICDDNNASALAADQIENSITSFPSVIHLYSYTAASGCTMLLGSGAADVGAPRLRPKTRFDLCPAPAGTPSNFTYNWTPALYVSDISAADPRAYVLHTTDYHVKTVDNVGCAHRDSAVVTVSVRHPKLEPTDTAFCIGSILPFRASGGINYAWTTTDTAAIFSCMNCNNAVVTPSMTSKYSVVISDKYNCADTLSANVIVHPLPRVKAYPKDTTVFYGGNAQLRATGASNYMWSPGFNLDNPGKSAPIASYLVQPTTYIVYGMDTNTCVNKDTLTININYRKPIFVPSAFTPNHDGQNDIFRVGGLTFEKVIEFRIFNRWGQEIFSEAGNTGWDGTWNGVVQDIGIYFYLIRVVYPDGYMETFQGELSLIR